MDPRIVEVGIVLAALGAWFGLYGLMLLATRPRAVRAAPATPDLGPEPPALVSLVCDGWAFTEDAVEATLLDLAGRKLIEFRQPANDPYQTTVHIGQPSQVDLTAYERRVLDRVQGLAVGGVLPLTALTFRDQQESRQWWKRLRAEVVADARARGLSRRRFSAGVVSVLITAAVLATGGVVLAVVHYALRHQPTNSDDDPWGFIIPAGLFTFAGLTGFASRYVGERDTAAGRAVAERWLGVKAWLRAHDSFADLPPASVAVWDRYVGYGAALGVSRVASAVIDMGMGNRRRVWSSYGGTWHRVRVRYPMSRPRYGGTARDLLVRGVLAGVLGFVLVRWWRPVFDGVTGLFADLPSWVPLVRDGGLLLGLGLLLVAAYQVIRVVVDLLTPVSGTGQVLWVQLCRSSAGGENRPSVPTLYHLAIDEGQRDRTTAWALPAGLVGRCETGDTVRITARRWTRRVLTVDVVERGHRTAGGQADAAADSLVTAMTGTGAARPFQAPEVDATSLLTADEVGRALGLPVVLVDLRGPGSEMVHFKTPDGKRVVLMLQVVDGTMGAMAWRANARGTQLAGIADGAWMSDNRAVVRVGDTTIVCTLLGAGKGRTQQYPFLLQQASSRVAARERPRSRPGPARPPR